MGIGSVAYKVVFLLHILSVIVGFGGVVLNGLYGAQAKMRPGPGGLAIGEANLAVSKVAEKVIMTVPVWGLLLVLLSDGVWALGQLWVGGSLALFLGVLAFAVLVQVKNAERMNALAAELVAGGGPPAGAAGPPPQVAMMEALGRKLELGGAFLGVSLLVLLALMIFKPGL